MGDAAGRLAGGYEDQMYRTGEVGVGRYMKEPAITHECGAERGEGTRFDGGVTCEVLLQHGSVRPKSIGQAPCSNPGREGGSGAEDRKSTRLNSSHGYISYAVFC